jgi:hypothetical protein
VNHNEAEKQDKEIAERRDGDMVAILVTVRSRIPSSFYPNFECLVQACLFSITVAAFTIESYNMLSLDLYAENMPLSTHILSSLSQRLVSASNGTPLPWQNVAFQGNALFEPSATAIGINMLWSLSLVLSLSTVLSILSVLSATSAEQSHRHFPEIAQLRVAPHKYGYTCEGSRPSRAVETVLYLSIFLFIVGLTDFLLFINTTVAFHVLLGFISVFSFACFVSTALPSLCLTGPRRNPLPTFAWRMSQILVLVILVLVGQIADSFMNLCRRFGIRLFCVQQGLLRLGDAIGT